MNSINIRIIPRLDIKGPNLVKGIHLEGLRVLGKPETFARHYYHQGADELHFVDTVASLYGRNNLMDIVSRTAREIFIPLCVGGGLRTIEDIRAVLRLGADKISINTAAIQRPQFISEAANIFGSSTIVVTIEAIRQGNGSYHCFTDSGRQATDIDAIQWAKQATELGAGEIYVTSVDQEGTGRGFDVELIKQITKTVSVPVIVHGGAGSVSHVSSVIQQGKASAVSLASLLHYDAIQKLDWSEEDFSDEGNIEFMRRKNNFTRVQSTSIPILKEYLQTENIGVRIEE